MAWNGNFYDPISFAFKWSHCSIRIPERSTFLQSHDGRGYKLGMVGCGGGMEGMGGVREKGRDKMEGVVFDPLWTTSCWPHAGSGSGYEMR